MYAFKRAVQAYVAASLANDEIAIPAPSASAAAAAAASKARSNSYSSSFTSSSSSHITTTTTTSSCQAHAKDEGLQVLAAGLPRCATTSLRAALEQLDLGLCMHMGRIYPKLERLKLVCATFDERDTARRQQLLRQLFAGFACSADTPGCMFVEDLVQVYPRVKLILNRRSSARAWLRSVTSSLSFLTSRTFHVLTYLIPNDYWFWHMHWKTGAYREQVLGYTAHPFLSEPHYDWHCDNVRRIARQYNIDILEFEPDMGWAPLCKFLGRPIPDAPFPHENESLVMKFIIAFVLARGVLAWSILGALLYCLYRYWP